MGLDCVSSFGSFAADGPRSCVVMLSTQMVMLLHRMVSRELPTAEQSWFVLVAPPESLEAQVPARPRVQRSSIRLHETRPQSRLQHRLRLQQSPRSASHTAGKTSAGSFPDKCAANKWHSDAADAASWQHHLWPQEEQGPRAPMPLWLNRRGKLLGHQQWTRGGLEHQRRGWQAMQH